MKSSFHLLIALASSFLLSCGPEEEVDASPGGRVFKTGCYPLDQDSTGPGLFSQSDHRFYYLDTIPVIDVKDFKDVMVSKSTGDFLVNLILSPEGETKFTAASEKYIGKSLAFVIENKLVMVPAINQKITGNSILVDGSFTEEEMIDCYRKIKASIEKN